MERMPLRYGSRDRIGLWGKIVGARDHVGLLEQGAVAPAAVGVVFNALQSADGTQQVVQPDPVAGRAGVGDEAQQLGTVYAAPGGLGGGDRRPDDLAAGNRRHQRGDRLRRQRELDAAVVQARPERGVRHHLRQLHRAGCAGGDRVATAPRTSATAATDRLGSPAPREPGAPDVRGSCVVARRARSSVRDVRVRSSVAVRLCLCIGTIQRTGGVAARQDGRPGTNGSVTDARGCGGRGPGKWWCGAGWVRAGGRRAGVA